MNRASSGKFLKVGLIAAFLCGACGAPAENQPPVSIEKNAAFSPEEKSDPLRLVVEIKANGVLSLNRIETGTIADLSVLSEKIEAIFDDRENNGILQREIFIRQNGGDVENEDLEKLIKTLGNLKASPIRIVEEK